MATRCVSAIGGSRCSIHTPGHTEDSICLYCKAEGVLFSGDMPLVINAVGGSYEDGFVCAVGGRG